MLRSAFVFGVFHQAYASNEEDDPDDTGNRQGLHVLTILDEIPTGINNPDNAQNSKDCSENTFYIHKHTFVAREHIKS